MNIKVIVACRNASGEPDFFPVSVECTEEEYDNGDHYEHSKSFAMEENYEGPFVCYDENDGPDHLFKHYFNDGE